MDIYSSVIGFIGVLVGGFITYFTTLKIERDRVEREGKVLSSSIAAEIASILSIISGHNYVEVFSRAGQRALRGGFIAITWNANRNYCRVFEGVVDKIGSLRCGSAEVVHFYNTLQSLIEDQVSLSKSVHEALEFSKSAKFDGTSLAPQYFLLSDKTQIVVNLGNEALRSLGYEAVKKGQK